MKKTSWLNVKRIKSLLLGMTVFICVFVFLRLSKDSSSSLCMAKQQIAGDSKKTDTAVPATLKNLQDSFVQVADFVKQAVVNITATHLIEQKMPYYEFNFGDPFEQFFRDFHGLPKRQPPQRKKQYRKFGATGSGVIIDTKGYILTNYHVVKDAGEIKVTLSGDEGHQYKGKIIGKDDRLDLAIVKIKSRKKLPVAVLGDSDKMKVGNWVLAVGSPFGLEQTVTAGIVSAIRQSVHIENRTYKELIQTDAAINQGNSGGPLVNIEGKVIGINTAIYAPMGGFVGVGFAIPINRAKEILDDLIHKGKVIRGWLGVEIRPVDEAIAKHFGLKKKEGALVNKVFANTPAEKGGLKRGDVILEFDGKKVKDSLSLQDIVGRTLPNKKVKVKIIRNMKEKKLQIVTEEMPDVSGEEEVIDSEESSPVEEEVSKAWLGMKVKTLTPLLIQRLGLSNDEKGVVIVEIEAGSIADEAGLLRGDCLRSINRKPVPNIKAFNQIIKKEKLSKGIVIDINRRGKLIYLSITE